MTTHMIDEVLTNRTTEAGFFDKVFQKIQLYARHVIYLDGIKVLVPFGHLPER